MLFLAMILTSDEREYTVLPSASVMAHITFIPSHVAFETADVLEAVCFFQIFQPFMPRFL